MVQGPRNGWLKKALPLHKWRRTQGMATFLRDLIALRKPIALCASCEAKMPRRWLDSTDYAFVKGFHAEGTACDYCRQLSSANLYHPVDGAYHQEMVAVNRMVEEVQARERALFNKDRRFLLGY